MTALLDLTNGGIPTASVPHALEFHSLQRADNSPVIPWLPEMVISRIVWCFLHPFELEPWSYHDNRLAAMLISPDWNRVIQNNADLWCSIFIDPGSSFAFLQSLFGRAKGLGLHFFVDIPMQSVDIIHPSASGRPSFVQRLISFLGTNLEKCSNLTIHSLNQHASSALLQQLNALPAPRLRILTLNLYPEAVYDRLLQNAPLLSRLSLHHSFVSPIAVNQMTELRLSRIRVDLALPWSILSGAITGSPTLERLHLLHVEFIFVNGECDEPSSRCHLPTLTHIDIAVSHSSTGILLPFLHLPSVRVIRLMTMGDYAHFMYRPEPAWMVNIHTAILEVSCHTQASVKDLLLALPSLERLDVRRCHPNFLSQLQGVVLSSIRLCPHLTHMHVGSVLTPNQVRDYILGRRVTVFRPYCDLTSPVLLSDLDVDSITHRHSVVGGIIVQHAVTVPDFFEL